MENAYLLVKPIFNGLMAYWKKEEKAVIYRLTLKVGKDDYKQELETIMIDKNKYYYTFNGLANMEYSITLECEDKNGDVIAISQEEHLRPLSFKFNSSGELLVFDENNQKATQSAGRAAAGHVVHL